MRNSVRMAALLALAFAAATVSTRAQESPKLTIDVTVVLKEAKVVFNLDHLAFDGDEPFGFIYMTLMLERFKADNTKWEVVAIFHGPAGYMALGDAAYNTFRKASTGNPYKEVIAELQAAGVRIEECGQTAKEHGWGNADLLPGVAVNNGANFRIIDLVQKGFVQIQP